MFHTGGDCVACQPLLFPTKPIPLDDKRLQAQFQRNLSAATV